MKKTTLNHLECAHCHQTVQEIVQGDKNDKIYCCYGCKVVDELLADKDHILEPDNFNLNKFLYLDEPKIRTSLLDFEENGFARITLNLPAIHCSSCIYLLESLPEIESSILEVEVQFTRKQAVITYLSKALNLPRLAALLDYIGYTPDFQTKVENKKKKKNTLLVQLGIAGFFFGNTMLLALPEYFNKDLSTEPGLQQFFRYLMMAFSIPVIAFSAKDYFINAAKSLRAGILSIDLPIALGISVLFLRSSYEVLSITGSGYFDSLTGLVFFLLIGKWYQKKTYENFTFDRDFHSFIPLAANLIKGEKEKPIAVDDLKKDDEIIVRQGEIIPADSILINSSAQVDYSYITGESIPVSKKEGDDIFAGGRIKGAAARLKVRNTVDRSYLASLWSKKSFKEKDHKKVIGLTDRISQYFTPAIVIIALTSAIAWSFYDTSKAITVFTAVLIVACPCALALAEPFASGSMMRSFGRYGFFLKNTDVLNRMQDIDHIVFDKTGTLTKQDNIRINWNGSNLLPEEKDAIASIAKNAQHPLARPLLDFLKTEQAGADPVVDFTETSGEGVCAIINGNIYFIGKGSFLGITDHTETTSVYVNINGEIKGYFSFFQEARDETVSLLHSLETIYELSLLSGDNEGEKKRFEKILSAGTSLKFNQSPHQKLEYLKKLRNKGQKVAMVGDGLNDAGALQQSHIGISLCEKNVNFFPASDALLMAGSFGLLDRFLYLSKQNKKLIHQAFALSLIYNLVGLSFAIAGILSPLVCAILMPVSSVSVVIFTSLTNRWHVRKTLDHSKNKNKKYA